MDENVASQELQKTEYDDFKENAQLKAIVAGQLAKKLSVTVNGVEIFIKAALPKGRRDQLIRIAKGYQAGDTENADKEIYDVLSSICLDFPYTTATAWAYVDEQTGAVPEIMKQVVEKITGVEASAKRFR